jgi:hypothetical protein
MSKLSPPEPPPPPHIISSGEKPKNLSRRKIIALSLVIIVILAGVAIYLAAFRPLPEKYVKITYNMHRLNQVGALTKLNGFSQSVPILKEQTLNGAVAFEVPSNYDQRTPIYPSSAYLTETGSYVIIWTKG